MKSFIITVACVLGMATAACAHTPSDSNIGTAPAAGPTEAAAAPAAYISQADFIHASEQTVNGVVSVKSYATPPQSYGNRHGGYSDQYTDPFLSLIHI